MVELRCLFLQSNNIEAISGLSTLQNLTNLNLCSNFISKLENLRDLPNLHTLLLSRYGHYRIHISVHGRLLLVEMDENFYFTLMRSLKVILTRNKI